MFRLELREAAWLTWPTSCAYALRDLPIAVRNMRRSSRPARRPNVGLRRRCFSRPCGRVTRRSAAANVGFACLLQGPTPDVRELRSAWNRRAVRGDAEQGLSLWLWLRRRHWQGVLIAGAASTSGDDTIVARRRRVVPASAAFRASTARPLLPLPPPPIKALPVLLERANSRLGSSAKAPTIPGRRANTARRTHSANDHRPWSEPPLVMDTIADAACAGDKKIYEAMPRILPRTHQPGARRNDFATYTEQAFTPSQRSAAIRQAPRDLGTRNGSQYRDLHGRNGRTLRFLKRRDGQPH